MTERRNGQPEDRPDSGTSVGGASDSAPASDSGVLRAVEAEGEPTSATDGVTDRAADGGARTGEHALIAGMRADRAALRALGAPPMPAGFAARAIPAAFEAADAEAAALAALEAEAPALGGLPVSGVEQYREPVLARLWGRRREFGMMAAALLVFVTGAAMVAGVRAIAHWASGPGPVARATQPETAPEAAPQPVLADAGNERTTPTEETPVMIASGDPVKADAWSAMADASAWESRTLASVFEAADELGTGRLVVYARSGSSAVTAQLFDVVEAQDLGVDHDFAGAGSFDTAGVDRGGIPAPRVPVIASEDGIEREPSLASRSGFVAAVRQTPAALAALRKSLENRGMTVEFRLLPEPLTLEPAVSRGGVSDALDLPRWASPPERWRRAAMVPVVIDSLPLE